MGAAIKAIVAIIVLYLVYGAYLYMNAGSADIMLIVTAPAESIITFLKGMLSGFGINF